MSNQDKSVVAGLLHLEILVDNPRESADYMRDVLGAVEVESDFAAMIARDFDCENIHMQAGGVIFQLIKPNDKFRPELADWWKRDQLKEHGPFIHNVTLLINDPETVAKKIVDRGGEKMGKVPAGTPDGAGTTDVYMYDARKQCGMIFEFIKTPPMG